MFFKFSDTFSDMDAVHQGGGEGGKVAEPPAAQSKVSKPDTGTDSEKTVLADVTNHHGNGGTAAASSSSTACDKAAAATAATVAATSEAVLHELQKCSRPKFTVSNDKLDKNADAETDSITDALAELVAEEYPDFVAGEGTCEINGLDVAAVAEVRLGKMMLEERPAEVQAGFCLEIRSGV